MKRKIAALLASSLLISSVPSFAFSDVDGDMSGAADYLYNLGIISGTDGVHFYANENIKRADFAIIMDKALNLPEAGENAFSDVPEDAYYKKAVNSAAAEGILSGMGDGRFCPDEFITAQQAAVILTKAYENKVGIKITYGNFADDLTDSENVAAWAKTAVNKALTMGFVEGEDGYLYPDKPITRGRVAEGVARFLNSAAEPQDWNDSSESYIEQINRGNIFASDEKAGFILHTEYPVVEMLVKDFWNEEVKHEYLRVTDKQLKLDFSDFDNGYYLVEFYAGNKKGLSGLIAQTTFCILEKTDYSDVTDKRFGMNMHCDRGFAGWRYDLYAEADKIGVKMIRDGTEWPATEPQKGVYSDSTYRDLLKYGNEYKMGLLTPTNYSNRYYDNGATPYTDEGRTGYANYTNAVYEMCGEDTYIDMFNEWYGPQFGDRGDGDADSLPSTYVPLLKKTYETIKAKHPEAHLGAVLASCNDWDKEVIALGGANYFDYVSFHSYTALFTNQNLLEKFKELPGMADKEYMLTETGCATSTNMYGHPEYIQAYCVPILHMIALNQGVPQIYWYDLIDDGNTDTEHEDRFGILHAFGSKYGNYTPKPAYVAYGTMTRMLKNKMFAEQQRSDDVRAYKYSGNGEDTYVFLKLKNEDEYGLEPGGAQTDINDDEEKNIVIYADSPVRVTDMMGKTKTYTPRNGKLYFTVSMEAFYLTGNISGFEVTDEVSVKEPDWTVAGGSYAIDVKLPESGAAFAADGRTSTDTSVVINPSRVSERRVAVIDASDENGAFARLSRPVYVNDKYTVTIYPTVENGKGMENGGFNIRLKNKGKEDMTVNSVNWFFADKNGTLDVNKKISADSEDIIPVYVGAVESGKKYNTQLQLTLDGESTGKIDADETIEYNLLRRKTVEVDGKIDEDMPGDYAIDLTDGVVVAIASDGSRYGGANDLSGYAYLTYDDDNLYLSADIFDNMHEATSDGEQIWRNDCLQFTVYAPENDNYDNTSKYFEFGVADSPSGPTIWQWFAINEPEDRSNLPGHKLAINTVGQHTYYEFSMPWASLGIDPKTQGNISMSIAVNDEDKGVRVSALSWGEGIVTGKNPDKFKSFIIAGGEADE